MYNATILDHNNYPYNFGELNETTVRQTVTNASCGDSYEIQLKIVEGLINDVAFTGSGCAISRAATDILLDLLRGQTVSAAQEIIAEYRKMIRGEAFDAAKIGEAVALQDIAKMPARTNCALLPCQISERL